MDQEERPTNSELRKFLLIGSGYCYSVFGSIFVFGYVIDRWRRMKFSEKQLLSLLVFVIVESFVCPIFKKIIRVAEADASSVDDLKLKIYMILSLIAMVAAIVILISSLNNYAYRQWSEPSTSYTISCTRR
ncbi:hypothetical protein PENTCL1PPCAC_3119 [Pristionchus entomophagus]|uniref:G protein-coupled receptor n=1 Tax=Pristionchus entomophagus TaxID=358040 RepID=A0AAV5SDL7_9BILA|nr:hypothetical protein PENTCL1PPCAC_3119 [Pristionchus entomophagus]